MSKINPTFDGEDIAKLLYTIKKARAKDSSSSSPESPDDRIIRAPLAHRTVPMCWERPEGAEEDDSRPGEGVVNSLSGIFTHLRDASVCLREMHDTLGLDHMDVNPDNLLLHYGKNGQVVYLLNDFDSGYNGRLKVRVTETWEEQVALGRPSLTPLNTAETRKGE